MLIKHIANLDDSDLIGCDEVFLSTDQAQWLNQAITQRLTGRPIAKIIGYKEFYGRRFHVTNDVLDPRPETELIIDEVLRHCKSLKGPVKILDLGTGSGCILLTLLSEMSNAEGVGTDISSKALVLCKDNAQSLNVINRCELIESNWLDNIEGQFDVIVTNPPYIETRTLADLDKDVRDYDPILALDGGEDGLYPYKVILPQIRTYLKPNGFFMCEHGTGQSGGIKRIVEKSGLSQIRIHHDLAGHDRCTSGIFLEN